MQTHLVVEFIIWRLIAAGKSPIEQAVLDGPIPAQSARNMIDAAGRELDRLTNPDENPKDSN